MSRKNWQSVSGKFSSTSVLILLSMAFDSVLSSLATSVKHLSSISLLVPNTRAGELLEYTLPEKVRAGSLVLPSDSETANLSSLREFSTANLSNLSASV